MIAGLDSSLQRPTPEIIAAARAAGIRLWMGYLATRPGVGLLSPWDQASFDLARRLPCTPIAMCSGWDDPAAVRQLAQAWRVRPCLDCEGGGLRDDGEWVQGWLDAAGAGLYGLAAIHSGRQATFHILADYPGQDPGVLWPPWLPRPSGLLGWQWQGTHTEFGISVDRGWYDDALGGAMPLDQTDLDQIAAVMHQVLEDELFGTSRPTAGYLTDMTQEVANGVPVGANGLSNRLSAIAGELQELHKAVVELGPQVPAASLQAVLDALSRIEKGLQGA